MPRLSTKQCMRRICLEIYCFSGEKTPETVQIEAGLSSGGARSSLGGWGVKLFPKGKERGPWQPPLQDRRKGTKGSWVNQGLGLRPGGSWHTQKRARKSLGLQPNQKWASQTNPNTALLHPLLEAGPALLPLGLYQLRLVSTKICGKWRSPVWWSVCLPTKLFTQSQKGLEISGWPFKRTKKISQINSGDDRNDCVFGKQDQGLALNIFKWTCMLGIVRSKPISGNRSWLRMSVF